MGATKKTLLDGSIMFNNVEMRLLSSVHQTLPSTMVNRTIARQPIKLTRHYKTAKTELSVVHINVCGLKSRMKCVEFFDFLNKYDIIMMTKTKLDDIDDLTFSVFKLITKNRKHKKRASGGVAVLIREELEPIIFVLKVKQQDSIWLQFESGLKNDLILCLIYIPPENSVY